MGNANQTTTLNPQFRLVDVIFLLAINSSTTHPDYNTFILTKGNKIDLEKDRHVAASDAEA